MPYTIKFTILILVGYWAHLKVAKKNPVPIAPGMKTMMKIYTFIGVWVYIFTFLGEFFEVGFAHNWWGLKD